MFRILRKEFDFFRENGHVILNPIALTEEEVELCCIYDDLFRRRAGRAEGMQFDLVGTEEEGVEANLPQILAPSRYAPEIKGFEFRAAAASYAELLLGGECEEGGEHVIPKPPYTGPDTPRHQNEAYWDPTLITSSLSIWMPLQDATMDSGCMQFVPQSHLLGALPNGPIHNSPRIHGLELDDFKANNIVACPKPVGGVTVHHCRTLHYSGANRTSEPRPAYIQIFGLPTKEYKRNRDFYWQRLQATACQSKADDFEVKDMRMGG